MPSPSVRVARGALVAACTVPLLLPSAVLSQAAAQRAPDPLVGRWTGAFVRASSIDAVAGEFVAVGDSLELLISMPDRPLRPSERVPVHAVAPGRYQFPTPYGRALVALDSAVQELVGTAGPDSAAMRVQLRRAPPPATYGVTRDTVRFASGRVTLPGILFRPAGVRRPAVAILVQGRGCGPITGLARLGEVLAGHGIAALAYDKRGADTTLRHCATTTIHELSEDVVAAARYLASRGDVDARRIGTVSRSAGGWVSARAAERAGLAFLALLVGPSTSVVEQQRGNMATIAHRLHLIPKDSADAIRYVDVTVARGGRAARYAELTRLLAAGRRVGWAEEFLEPDDIAESEAAADSLWARRNAYDPAPDLRRFRGPILALYGGADEVVPAEENVALLRRIAADAGNARVRAVIVPEAGHGLEQDAHTRQVDLGAGAPLAYWKSLRTAPQLLEELTDFLRRYGFTGDAR